MEAFFQMEYRHPIGVIDHGVLGIEIQVAEVVGFSLFVYAQAYNTRTHSAKQEYKKINVREKFFLT
jgi:hypothetical protein